MDNIPHRVSLIIANTLGFPIEQITPGMSLREDLGTDSLDDVDIVLELEDTFDIAIADEEAERWKTVGDVIEFMEKAAA